MAADTGSRASATDGGREVAELALQLGRLAYGDCPAGGLTPAQWTALRYFARANRFSRTVSGFAEFHATTRGTASQTIKSLVGRGLLRRSRSPRDGRSVHFDLTPHSHEILHDDPFEAVVRAITALGESRQTALRDGLRDLLQGVAGERERGLTGRCALCGHLSGSDAGPWRCGLLDEPLEATELEQLCARFRPAADGSG